MGVDQKQINEAIELLERQHHVVMTKSETVLSLLGTLIIGFALGAGGVALICERRGPRK